MTGSRMDGHDPLRSARLVTGAALLAGLLLLGAAVGVAAGQPALGLFAAAGTWLVAVALIRAARGL